MQTFSLYANQVGLTSAGRFADLFNGLPNDVGALCSIAQGLLIHEHLAESYGVELTDEQRVSVHLRRIEDVLRSITRIDDRPLTETREPGSRAPGNCRQFTVLLVSMLRSRGIPARARCGFGTYFRPGRGEDHWVAEYWLDGRWRLADAQIDDHQRRMFAVDFDTTDVPRDRFLVAGDAWRLCRAGRADENSFGLGVTEEAGYWWIAGNLMRDVAALNNAEMLPWDAWGAMPLPDDRIEPDRIALFDRLAALTASPDDHLAELREVYESDELLRVGPVVHNVLRSRNEASELVPVT